MSPRDIARRAFLDALGAAERPADGSPSLRALDAALDALEPYLRPAATPSPALLKFITMLAGASDDNLRDVFLFRPDLAARLRAALARDTTRARTT